MKQRLSDMIQNAVGGCAKHWADIIADHLLAEGVIVPPVCMVGQTVYIPWNYGGARGITFCEVTHIITDYKKSYVRTNFSTDDEGFWEAFNGGQFAFEDFGKTVFLTREEAEKALAERGGE